MDFGRGFSYMRQDPNWIVKTVLGSVISIVPILNFAATGYGLDVIRNVSAGRETPLPEWGENFGDLWVRGLIGTVVALLYALPILLVGCIFGITMAGSAARMQAQIEAGGQAGGGVGAAGLCLIPLLMVAGVVFGAMGLIGQARYAITNNFAEAMRFGQVWEAFRAGLGRWITLLVMLVVVGIASAFVAGITCGLAVLFSFFVVLAQSHWVAQAYRESTRSLEPSIG